MVPSVWLQEGTAQGINLKLAPVISSAHCSQVRYLLYRHFVFWTECLCRNKLDLHTIVRMLWQTGSVFPFLYLVLWFFSQVRWWEITPALEFHNIETGIMTEKRYISVVPSSFIGHLQSLMFNGCSTLTCAKWRHRLLLTEGSLDWGTSSPPCHLQDQEQLPEPGHPAGLHLHAPLFQFKTTSADGFILFNSGWWQRLHCRWASQGVSGRQRLGILAPALHNLWRWKECSFYFLFLIHALTPID